MLSLSDPIHGPGGEDYYLDLCDAANYYADIGLHTEWGGTGSKRLGLSGPVKKEELQNLLKGFSPDGNKPLVQNAGKADRVALTDAVFSAPKSVSIVATLDAPGGVVRKQNVEALRTIFPYMEEITGRTRRGKAGQRIEKADLVVPIFEDLFSRSLDPQLHLHCPYVHVCVRKDGTTGTPWTQKLFDHKMTLGALYRAELAARLRRLGYEIRATKHAFEIGGVSLDLISEFSKRRKQIERALSEGGFDGAVAAKIAALDTRPQKPDVSLAELLTVWKDLGRRHNYTTPLRKPQHEVGPPRRTAAGLASEALDRVAFEQGKFTEANLVRAVAEAAPQFGIGAREIIHAVKAELRKREVLSCGYENGERIFTTRTVRGNQREVERELAAVLNSTPRALAPVTPTMATSRTNSPEPLKVREPANNPRPAVVTPSEKTAIASAISRIEKLATEAARASALVERVTKESQTRKPEPQLHPKKREEKPPLLRFEWTYRRLFKRRTSLPHLEILVPRLAIRVTNPFLIYDTKKITRFLHDLFVGRWPKLKNHLLYQNFGMKLVLAHERPAAPAPIEVVRDYLQIRRQPQQSSDVKDHCHSQSQQQSTDHHHRQKKGHSR